MEDIGVNGFMDGEANEDIDLEYTKQNTPQKTIENFYKIISNDRMFDSVKFNLLTNAPEWHYGNTVYPWIDCYDAIMRMRVETKYEIYHEKKLDDAFRMLCKNREYHPIRDIIDELKWDGKERIPHMLTKWLKCEDSAYTREVSRLIFAGGINRLYNPGCKFDDMPVLIGTKQGEGKSTFVRWLAIKDEFFREVNEFDGQKGMEALEGAWICEVSELLAVTRVKEQEAVKSYLTRLNDTYRMPFDKRVTSHARQCIFVGTTNKRRFLNDKTGNRRFFPVVVHQNGYDLFDNEQEIKGEILQCWAEAKAKYDAGKMPPYADRKLADEIRKHQEAAVEDDYREGMIEAYIEGKDRVSIIEIWREGLKIEFERPTRKESNEIAMYLDSTGRWKNVGTRMTKKYGNQKSWVPIKADFDSELTKISNDGNPFLEDK